jgi:hypothetical protein
MSELNRIVVVGAYAENGWLDFDTHGPFTSEEADKFVNDVREVWDTHDSDEFEFGRPTVYVKNLLHRTHPIYSRAAQAAANWYEDKEL